MKESAAALAAEQVPARSHVFGESVPFLEQSKAQNTLRHELQRLFDAVEARIADASAADGDAIAECSASPNRIVARRGAGAISFSWLTGRLGGVSDGYLLVIEWAGIPANKRGVQALTSATLARETSYHPEAEDAASWRWRAGQQQGSERSTLDLVAEWFASASSVARHQLAQA